MGLVGPVTMYPDLVRQQKSLTCVFYLSGGFTSNCVRSVPEICLECNWDAKQPAINVFGKSLIAYAQMTALA